MPSFFPLAVLVACSTPGGPAAQPDDATAGQFHADDSSVMGLPTVDLSPPIPDTTAPTWVPDALAAQSVSDAEVTLSWTRATDDVGVVAYRLIQDHVPVAEVSGDVLTHTVTGLQPHASHVFSVRAGDAAGNWSSEGPAVTVLTHCLPPAYAAYLNAAPHVAAASVERLDATAYDLMCAQVRELETTGTLLISEPAASVACVEPASCGTITLTDAERSAIVAARVSHALWLEVEQRVPWRLAEYDSDDLDGLFAPSELLTNGLVFVYVVDHSPCETYAYLVDNGLIGDSIGETMTAVVADLRSTDTRTSFVHGIGGRDPTHTAYTVLQALQTWTDSGSRVSRRGCHSMSRIALAVLRSVNIPGVERHNGQWYFPGHSTPVWPAVAQVLPHGDDLYSAILRTVPADSLLADTSAFTDADNLAICGANSGCLASRHRASLALQYPAVWTSRRCCAPSDHGFDSCSDYLTDSYSDVLTEHEIAQAAAALEADCP